jgi:hypothetical protein
MTPGRIPLIPPPSMLRTVIRFPDFGGSISEEDVILISISTELVEVCDKKLLEKRVYSVYDKEKCTVLYMYGEGFPASLRHEEVESL